MTPRALDVVPAARRDLDRRARFLAGERGEAFAADWYRTIVERLNRIATGGARLGTVLGDDPEVRSFGYRGEATVIARFTEGQMSVLRVYFRGQDWSARH